MPYLVWIDLTGPESEEDDELASAQVPELVLELIEGGWEVTAPVFDDEADEDDDEPPELLDVRVLGYPGGVFVGLAVDTESIDVGMAFGASLGRHLRDAAPALMGWTVDSLRVDKTVGPDDEGSWFPPLGDEPRPRLPLAEHLPWDVQKLSAQYLIAGAVRHLVDPTLRGPWAIDVADMVAGAALEHPWDREVIGALGGLLVSAGKVEREHGVRGAVAGRGEGDPALAQALVDAVRREIDTPSGGHDEDDVDVRGHDVLEQFMGEHQLAWNRTDDDRRGRQLFRTLLWAGLRALAAMTSSVQGEARSPWMWLSALDDSPVVEWFADQDDEERELSDEDAHGQIAAAARAHLLVRIALLHPDRLADLDLEDVDTEPVQHLFGEVLAALGVETAPTGLELRPALRYLTDTGRAAGPEKVGRATRMLLRSPAELACVLVDQDDEDVDAVLRRFLIALACGVAVDVAASVAAELPELTSSDPRDEPALRHEAVTWLGRIIEADGNAEVHPTVVAAVASCPPPGAGLLTAVASGDRDPMAISAMMSTSDLVVGVAQALSALSLTGNAPWLPLEFLVG